MNVIINGEPRRIEAQTLSALLQELGYEGQFYAIAVNEAVVPRAEWNHAKVQDGDRIEIVTPRQGG